MQIQSICSNINRPFFKGKFEANNDLNRLMDYASDKDLMEFSLMIDVINNSKDSNIFYIKEKKPSALNPDKGFILWCQEHWDSFPKPYKSCIVNDIESKVELAPILAKFTDLLKSVYKVNFEKDIKSHFKNQIVAKLSK
jgi:hypothetical protein